ncbi:MAG: undecaprenyldiphospho-muramoylpentapeptide beta-N-acetylglucosaminyltransferase [Gemmatimonadota bacterium]|nr:undecaprenyldiphospho-muramoylpentapeptide beta-N-acetylglucosaminyltransferase [Gemmatimonadota bacterium]
MPLRLLFAVTLTGGHTVPALGVAAAVRKTRPDTIIRFAGVARGVEARLVPRAGYVLDTLPVIGLKRRLHPDLLHFPWSLLKGICSAFRILITYHPHTVICTGGHVSGPVGVAARLLGIPLVLHESNNYPGLTVRLLSRAARQVYLAFEGARRRVGGREKHVVGNPIRDGWRRVDRKEARRRLGLEMDRITLFVTGASQGSMGINLAVAEALTVLTERGYQILWQTGSAGYHAAASAARPCGGRVVVREFIDDMALAFSAADLALTRAGAITVTEMTQLGVPALMVPLPLAAENHQVHNARAVVRAGAARMVHESELSAERLVQEVSGMIDTIGLLSEMARRSRALAVPDAAARMVEGMAHSGLLRGER